MVNDKTSSDNLCSSVSKFVTHVVVLSGIIYKMEFLPSDNTYFSAKADEALKAKERNEEEAKRRKEEGKNKLQCQETVKLCTLVLDVSHEAVHTSPGRVTPSLLRYLPPCVLRLTDQATLVEQVKRVKEIEAIESDSFVQQTFRSSKEVKKSIEPSEAKLVTPASGPASGPASVAADLPSTGKEIDPDSIPTSIKYQDDNSLAHPN
ncbi:hypothetical protein STEG23_012147, partial [Scotinomys teguina]